MDNQSEITNREFAQMTEEIKTNTEAIKTLINIIRGNGTPGLVIRVDRLERDAGDAIAIKIMAESSLIRIDTLEVSVKEITNFIKDVKRGVWSFVFVFVLFLSGIAWGLWTHQIEIIMK